MREPWTVTMAGFAKNEHVRVMAHSYEDAVCEFEAWCIENDVERRGAIFERGTAEVKD